MKSIVDFMAFVLPFYRGVSLDNGYIAVNINNGVENSELFVVMSS